MTPAETARRYRGGASLEVLAAATGRTVPETRAALVAAGETIRGAGRPESRAQVLAVRWYAEQRAAARVGLAAIEARAT